MSSDRGDDCLYGMVVGRFRLLRLIAEGGMSSVYLAEWAGDFHQIAAVKPLRDGLHDPETRGRFRGKQQVLASNLAPRTGNYAHI